MTFDISIFHFNTNFTFWKIPVFVNKNKSLYLRQD